MNLNKISNFIKLKRKELGITQDELAEKLFVTEKAISRWETGRGTPDISLFLPLSKELNVEVSELLNGEESKKTKDNVEQLLDYNEIIKNNKFNFQFKLVVFFYVLSILSFLFYLRFEYDPNIELNYFIRLFFIVFASLFVIVGNKIYENDCVEKIEKQKKVTKFSHIIIFIYYIILLFNMVVFARYNCINSYNLIPFKSIIGLINNGTIYSIIINIFGNLLIFMPLEYFIVELFKVKSFKLNFVLSVIIISLIELLQFVFKVGVLDVDDLIICTLGMMLFYVFYNLLVRRNKEKSKGGTIKEII